MENTGFEKIQTHTHIDRCECRDECIYISKNKLCTRQVKRKLENWKTDFRRLPRVQKIEIEI